MDAELLRSTVDFLVLKQINQSINQSINRNFLTVLSMWYLLSITLPPSRGGSRKKYLGGLAPHHLGGNKG